MLCNVSASWRIWFRLPWVAFRIYACNKRRWYYESTSHKILTQQYTTHRNCNYICECWDEKECLPYRAGILQWLMIATRTDLEWMRGRSGDQNVVPSHREYTPYDIYTIFFSFVLLWLYYGLPDIHVIHLPIFRRVPCRECFIKCTNDVCSVLLWLYYQFLDINMVYFPIIFARAVSLVLVFLSVMIITMGGYQSRLTIFKDVEYR